MDGNKLRDLHAKKPLVERTGKEGIEQVLMNEGQPQDAPAEAKPAENVKNTDVSSSIRTL